MPEWVNTVGYEYKNGNIQQNDKAVQSAYETLAQHNRELFESIPVPVVFQSQDPYEDYEDMAQTVAKEQQLRIFSGGSTPEYLSPQHNLMGRAVHDWYGHLAHDCDFTPKGEFTKWYHMSDMYPDSVTQILFAEVVGQVSVVNKYGWDMLEQRCIAAPSSWIKETCEYYNVPMPAGSNYHDSKNLGKLTPL
jgi:hypothetical protein